MGRGSLRCPPHAARSVRCATRRRIARSPTLARRALTRTPPHMPCAEGVSRMQTSLRRRHRDRVVRRGLALIIESDFYATDAGRQHFADQLTSIRYCVQEVRARPRPAPRAAAAHARPGYLRRPATSTRSTLTCRRPTTTSPVRHTPHTPPWRLHARSHARRALCCADDRAKNLRPKRNIKTAMNNGARVCDF